MIRIHIRIMVGLMLSPTQRTRSIVVLLGSSTLFSFAPSWYRSPDWVLQAMLLLLTAALLVQWRAALFEPVGTQPDLPIPVSRQTVEWITSVLQVGAVGVMSLIMRVGWAIGVGQEVSDPLFPFTEHLMADVLGGMVILLPTVTLMSRFMRGIGGDREVLIWASAPALAALSIASMAFKLPNPVVYTLALAMLVALAVTAALLIGRLVGWLRVWRQRTGAKSMLLCRQGKDAEDRLVTDSRTGILRALGWLIASDTLGWCLLWFAFSSWMFHDIGLDAHQAQNYVAPFGLAILVGVRILALASALGQIGLVGGFQPWPNQPWSLLPLPRTTIQRALLRHITVVALVAIGLNITFLITWAGATDALMWSPQHVQLRGLIASMVQIMAILTAIMAMAFMVVGTGLRGVIQLTTVAASTFLSGLIYVDNISVPGDAAAYVPSAVANTVAVALLLMGVWAISWHQSSKPA